MPARRKRERRTGRKAPQYDSWSSPFLLSQEKRGREGKGAAPSRFWLFPARREGKKKEKGKSVD